MSREPKRTFKFTDRAVAAIKPPRPPLQLDYFDATLRGFGLRVSYGGRKTWFVMYRRESDGKNRRKKIGPYPAMPLVDAKERAGEALNAAAKGGDPAKDRKSRRLAETVKELCDRFIQEYAIGDGGEVNPRKRSWFKDKARLDNYVIPEIGSYKAVDVTRSEIRALIKSIKSKGVKGKPAPVASNRTLEVVRKMFNWAIEEEIVPGLETNPAVGIKRLGEEKERTRDLTPDELAAFWKALDQDEAQDAADVLRLMLLLDQRRNEIVKVERPHVDRREHWLNIPPEITKTKFPYRIPLNEPAIEIVNRAWGREDRPRWLFAKAGGAGPMSETKIRECFVRSLERADVKDFRPHDLVHVATSGMTAMGIDPHIVRKIRHHTDGETTTDRYDHYRYDREKRQAIEAWGRRLMEIVMGAQPDQNVVALRR
jgi:integrase